MKKKIWFIVGIILIILILLIGAIYLINTNKDEKESKIQNEEFNNNNAELNLVLSLEDKITDNSVWCGTFNLIWNDLKNELAMQDIVFNPQLEIVENLNKGTFTSDNLSEESYYKKYGVASLELKEQIEKAIKEKFNEESDILDDFDWKNVTPDYYFLYAMLKKEFEFPKEFTELENGSFGNYTNTKYFGINSNTSEEVRNQVKVLYYNSKDDFAIKLLTKSNDEVIISKGVKGETFGKIYEEIMQQSKKYEGNTNFSELDTLKIPNISFDVKKELEDLENKGFYFSNGEEYRIEKALQTIKFDLDKKGGEIKSEAGMMINKASISIDEPREFSVDNTFTMLLIENGKELPYFASKISDISNVQNN